MDMVSRAQITAAGLSDRRKLGQGLHARFVTGDFGAGVRFLAAIDEVGQAAGHHPEVRICPAHVDLKLVSQDAVYRDEDGTEHQVEWTTERDVDLARRISEVAAGQSLSADPDRTARARGSGSTSTSRCRTTSPSSGSPPRWRPVP